eukprot:TRINITY_DN5835_c0_g1_i2.p2 TRINITY_DN5835_c0_g1~~TRINITY_DN5835_c0_g1_i2.p2  ORF type:complete len:310 (-),score=66.68 TRINITY_DN5835_c0_g1_i2:113-1042(-)
MCIRDRYMGLFIYYFSDQFRRIVCETLIPFIMKVYGNCCLKRGVTKYQRKTLLKRSITVSLQKNLLFNMDGTPHIDANDPEVQKFAQLKKIELSLTQYDPFDDYFELVTQYGYNTLFAAAFPMACVCSFIVNCIELVNDRVKLTHFYRRPLPTKAFGIGSWLTVLKWLNHISVLTNLALFAYSSDQITAFFPSLFPPSYDRRRVLFKAVADKMNLQANPLDGQGRWVVGIIFGIEHVLYLIIFLINYLIPSKPNWVETLHERAEYRKSKRLSNYQRMLAVLLYFVAVMLLQALQSILFVRSRIKTSESK